MRLARLPVLVAILALVLLLVSGPGTRMDLWTFRTGFSLMTWATYLGLAAAALAILLLLIPRARRGHAKTLVFGMLMGFAATVMPLLGYYTAKTVPFIHDISTDTMRPPEFVAILPLRDDAPNPATYGGAEVAAAQKAGYPDLATQILDQAPADAFAHAEKVARDMGWEIVAAVPEAGRIEATDTTFWFGFKDDIVIRIEAEGEASRIDIRSVSRVGKSDVGKNASRIRAFVKALGSHPIQS
ncbi:MAG TPA: DUF1499 domain-containing protein [Dokdonella sp.]|uniref:DUF1499 domain-containing protein n=1 Tax=Dokdonella sp. TaxID=2291710 RepID=UPI002D7EC1EC|nr:DUF1499 domain-containing protein [Dokdonella sp.]HET9031782.1 DUF1499 domain-containing protein [Dokdonella sp.]